MVMKHSWKGKYKRIFSVGLSGITTHNPSNMESTNTWLYQVNLNTKYSPSLLFCLLYTSDAADE